MLNFVAAAARNLEKSAATAAQPYGLRLYSYDSLYEQIPADFTVKACFLPYFASVVQISLHEERVLKEE